MKIGKRIAVVFLFLAISATLSGCPTPLITPSSFENADDAISASSASLNNMPSDIGYVIDISIFSVEYDNYLLCSGEQAGAYFDYPVVSGMMDLEKQDRINAILKQELCGSNDKEFDSDSIITCKAHVRFMNEDLLSFVCSRYANHTDAAHPSYSSYGVTIDMRAGKKVHLTDIMEVDERLINSGDGNLEEPDYYGELLPIFHKFKDAFEIYISDEERDAYHRRSQKDVIEELKCTTGVANWYITENMEIVFLYINNWISIPYQNLADLIYPKYLAILEK